LVDLRFEALSASYGRIPVLHAASAHIAGGAVTGLIGPNGSGKSTLLRAIAGLIPARGEVSVDGEAMTGDAARTRIAYMPQDVSASSSLTLLEVVLLGRLKSLGLTVPAAILDEAHAALDRFGLGPMAGRTLDSVSGGQRQLAYLAQALFRRPRVLLLDEPTAALDLRHQLVVLETVRAMAGADGIAVMIAIHDLSLAAQFADRFICLHEGGIDCIGGAQEVLTPEKLRRIYRVDAEVVQGPDGKPRITPLRAALAAP